MEPRLPVPPHRKYWAKLRTKPPKKLGSVKQKIKILVCYLGNGFCGWQPNPGSLPSVEETLHTAISASSIGNFCTCPTPSGRTDKGVHARQQTAHLNLRSNCSLDLARWREECNARLAHAAVWITAAAWAGRDFHAKLCISKEYRYYLLLPPRFQRYLTPFNSISTLFNAI